MLISAGLSAGAVIAPNDCQDLLFRDVVYSAIGLSTVVSHQEID